ncbi:MAG: RNA methyltransferase [Gammaproteobacteria bacterium]|nr:MAG: RNA methyltransferase [Gammaproteobacteria bacterium]
MFERIRFVLMDTSHPGNIGAAARAMKTMGLSRLYLVHPRHFPSAEATARASGADDVLARAVVCQSLEEAIQGCTLVCGTSARSRHMPWPEMEARACARKAIEEAREGEVALVFGGEHSGLSNEALDRCQFLVTIPTHPGYRSLNLGAAVQVMAYEILMAAHVPMEKEHPEPLARAEEVEGFFRHLESALVAIGFLDPRHPKKLMRRLRRLFHRARLERTEVHILRGILRACQQNSPHRDRSNKVD